MIVPNEILLNMQLVFKELHGKHTMESHFRIHPDDYRELRRQTADMAPREDDPLSRIEESFYGLKLILDETAPRLQRRSK